MDRTLRRLALVSLTWAAVVWPASAQTDRPAADLAGAVPTVASVVGDATVPQLHIRWQVAESPSGGPVRPADMIPLNRFAVVARSSLRGPLVRERDPQWSEDELIVVAVDGTGRETSWQRVRDPRILRAELPGPTGELTGDVLYLPEAELVAVVPDATTTGLLVYETRWTGEQFVLRQLGRVDVTVP